MGKAGKALSQVLETHDISQSRLANALGVELPLIHCWLHEETDLSAETVVKIVDVLREISPIAAKNFINLFFGRLAQDTPSTSLVVTHHHLPESDQVNTSILARLFDDTTNSYKYLFFFSLLDILQRRKFDVLPSISFEEIVVEMLANAWYAHTYFKLSFGLQDQIAAQLDSLPLQISEPILKFTDTDKTLLRKTITDQNIENIVNYISRYVPFRLIRPFFLKELVGLPDAKVNQNIVDLAEREFNSFKPLYRFDSSKAGNCTSIRFHEEWVEYIETNYRIVRAWASWKWLNYMQRRNPNVPGIVNKLFMPRERSSLGKQSKYWKAILEKTSIQCIYSRKIVNPKSFSLDHYVPWSFVAHDQLWNLIPTPAAVNSSKSNNLPAHQYFREFVSLQHAGLTTFLECFGRDKWINNVEPFIADLKLSDEDLLDRERLQNAYEAVMQPLLSLAQQQGFTPNWLYL